MENMEMMELYAEVDELQRGFDRDEIKVISDFKIYSHKKKPFSQK